MLAVYIVWSGDITTPDIICSYRHVHFKKIVTFIANMMGSFVTHVGYWFKLGISFKGWLFDLIDNSLLVYVCMYLRTTLFSRIRQKSSYQCIIIRFRYGLWLVISTSQSLLNKLVSEEICCDYECFHSCMYQYLLLYSFSMLSSNIHMWHGTRKLACKYTLVLSQHIFLIGP